MVLMASYLDIDKQQSSRIWSELYNWCFGSVKLRYNLFMCIGYMTVWFTWQNYNKWEKKKTNVPPVFITYTCLNAELFLHSV